MTKFGSKFFTADCSDVYTTGFLDMATVIISIDNQVSTKRLASSTVFYLEYPTGIEAHDLKLMVA